MEKEIEYETVSLKVPKRIMDFLRGQKDQSETVQEYLEYIIVDTVRSDITGYYFPMPEPAQEPKELADNFGLNPIFKAITDTEVL